MKCFRFSVQRHELNELSARVHMSKTFDLIGVEELTRRQLFRFKQICIIKSFVFYAVCCFFVWPKDVIH